MPETPRVSGPVIEPATPPISEIIPGLFLADILNFSEDRTLLGSNNVKAVVSLLANGLTLWQLPKFTDHIQPDCHLWIKCADSSTQNLLIYMNQVCIFIDENLSSSASPPRKVLVHCDRGVSRSPTMVIAYLMWKWGLSRDEALTLVQEKRKVRPNKNFMDQLEVWGRAEYCLWEDEENTVPKEAYVTKATTWSPG